MKKSARSCFADGAGRLDRFLNEVKARQYDAAGSGPPPKPVPPQAGRHPDEAWIEHYGVRSIRLRGVDDFTPPLPEYVVAPPDRPYRQPERPREPVAAKINADPIGAVVGKPGRKRGIFGRLFGGRDI